MSLENMPTVAPKTQLGLKIIPMATKPSFTLNYDLINLVVATFVQKLCRRWLNLSGFTIDWERTEKDWIILQSITTIKLF